MDKQQNELRKSYARTRKLANQGHQHYEVTYAFENPKFDVIDFENFKQLDKIANFIARNPKLIEKFKKQIHDMSTDHAKVILAHQIQLHPYFKNFIPNFLFSAIKRVLRGQADKIDKSQDGYVENMNNAVDILGSYGAFENMSSRQMSELLIEYYHIFDTVKKYFKMKFLDGEPLFNFIYQFPTFIDKEEININTIKEDDFYSFLNRWEDRLNLKNHPKVVNYEYKSYW